MMRASIVFACAAALPAALYAAPSPAPAAKPAAPVAVAPAGAAKQGNRVSIPIKKRLVMTQEGNKTVAQMAAVPDQRVQQIQAEVQQLLLQKAQFLVGDPIDLAKLEALLRRETALAAEFRTRQDDRLLQIMRALSENDRIAFLQARATTQAPRPANAPAAAPQPAAPPAAPAGGN